MIIYQIFTRVFGNRNSTRKKWGSIAENGSGKMNDIDDKVLNRIREMGITHVWYTGVVRHATQTDYSHYGIPSQSPDVVKGYAGSPYAITDYYDVDPDLAENVDKRMEEWEALILRTHKAGLKVIMDFVPNHVAREYHSVCSPDDVADLGENDDVNKHFSVHNNFYYCWGQSLDLSLISSFPDYHENPAKATGNDCFCNRPGRNDWYETVKLNYGIDYCDAGGRSEHFDPVPDTWNKMREILLFWSSKGIDGFRCDMAEMVPSAFWEFATGAVKETYPHVVFIGEVYNPALYRTYIAAGFDYLYDKVGMYDCLRGIVCRHRWAADITAQWQCTDDIRSHMLYFLENHDEQRIASKFFAGDPWRAYPAHIVSCLLRPNPYMLYAGQEMGECGMDEEGFSGCDGRTTIFDYWSLDSINHGYYDVASRTPEENKLMKAYKRVMHVAEEEKAANMGTTFDLMYVNGHIAQYQFAFLRKQDEDLLLVVVNFSEQDVCVDVKIPAHAFEFLKLPQKQAEAHDLIGDGDLIINLVPDGCVNVFIPHYGGVVYKIRLL